MDRLPLLKEKLCDTQSVDAVNGSNHKVTHDEIPSPRVIAPAINSRPIFVLEQASLKIGLVGKVTFGRVEFCHSYPQVVN